jgi:hypothetical protein
VTTVTPNGVAGSEDEFVGEKDEHNSWGIEWRSWNWGNSYQIGFVRKWKKLGHETGDGTDVNCKISPLPQFEAEE